MTVQQSSPERKKRSRNITLGTVDKVRDIVTDEDLAFTVNSIATRNRMHQRAVKSAFDQLQVEGVIRPVPNRTNVALFVKVHDE